MQRPRSTSPHPMAPCPAATSTAHVRSLAFGAGLLAIAATLAPAAAAQTGGGAAGTGRKPGTLDKAFEALVGTESDIQVREPQVEDPRPEDPVPAAPVERDPEAWRYSVIPFAEQRGRVDIDEGGTMDLRRAGLELRASRIRERGRGLILSGRFESGTYDFDGATSLVPAAAVPVEDVLWSRFGATWLGAQDREWSWIGGVALNASAEQDAALEDSLSLGGFAQTTYRIDQDLGVVLGAFGRTELEDDPLLLPILGLDWRLDESTQLRTIGPRMRLTRDLDDGRSIFADLAYSDRQYRLDGIGPLPGGSFNDRDLTAVAGFDWHPGLEEWGPLSGSSGRIYAGTTLWRELEFRADDERVSQSDPSSSWVLGISVNLNF